MAETSRVFCSFCGTTAPAKIQWRGSRAVARNLWLIFTPVAPFYNYWQWKGRKPVCSYCGSEYIGPPRDNPNKGNLTLDEIQAIAQEEPFLATPLKPQAPRPEEPKPPRPGPQHDPNQF